MLEELISEFQEHFSLVKILLNDRHFFENLQKAVHEIISALKKRKYILICGNGGSAADAQHLAAELVGRFEQERRSFPVLALTTNTSSITAIGNDYSFEEIFSRQVEAYGEKEGVLIAISTSGRSRNVIRAVKKAKELGMYTIGLTGNDGGDLGKLVDCHINVPYSRTARIQEIHELIYHAICYCVEKELMK